MNSNVGPVATPPLGAAAKAAALFVNSKLDGVDGHPIQFTDCNAFGASAAQGQACGDQFGNSSAIKAVLLTGTTIGGPQLAAANAKRKVYFCAITDPTEATLPNVFCTSGGPLASGAIATYTKDDLHAKTLAFLTTSEPSLLAVAQQQKALFAKFGITVKIGSAPAAATDVTQAVLASGAASADAVYLQIPTPGSCAPYIKALKTLAPTKPTISLGICMDSSIQQQLGSLPPYTFLQYGPISQAPDPTGQYNVYSDVTSAYQSQVGSASANFAPQVFGDVLLMDKIFNELGANNLTTKAIAAKLKSYTGGAFAGDPRLKFGVPPFPSAGSLRGLLFTHHVNGSWTAAADGAWLAAPK